MLTKITIIHVGSLRATALLVLLALWATGSPAAAQGGADPLVPVATEYLVLPGDTLPDLARRFGTDVTTLQHLNGIADPRQVHPGQILMLPERVSSSANVIQYIVTTGEDFYTLAWRAGVSWEALGIANRLLNPETILVGQTLTLPSLTPVVPRGEGDGYPLVLALRSGISFWSLASRPSYTYATDESLAFAGPMDLPSPLRSLDVSPQPVVRGQTAHVLLGLDEAAICEVVYLGQRESCYAQESTRLHAFIGLPALLEPGRVPLVFYLRFGETEVTVPMSLTVAPGRYDYERVDLPPSRQGLLDPVRSQAERETIATLRNVRTPERYWEFPFIFPIEGGVTSYYGSRRSYGSGYNSVHGGTDFRAEKGAAVVAPASGVVILAEPLVVRGNAILIDHGWGVVTGYWHLSAIEVRVGQAVTQGELIGEVGNTGLSTGPHLHWELWVNGVSVDALQWVAGGETGWAAAME